MEISTKPNFRLCKLTSDNWLEFCCIFLTIFPDHAISFLSAATEVYFDETPVPVENVLGEVGHGFKVRICVALGVFSFFFL